MDSKRLFYILLTFLLIMICVLMDQRELLYCGRQEEGDEDVPKAEKVLKEKE